MQPKCDPIQDRVVKYIPLLTLRLFKLDLLFPCKIEIRSTLYLKENLIKEFGKVNQK
ncbi:unnamed protein product (macronuclear) [Paramecium tetraurelia]|uniref:Uncharacterized protein n=1 Tax=Paramecium tetraurelia TaxID=5888 RepID=A0DEH9_PARTE|nr:uncharacterized protein GSPATT00016272001 [Paramecium tetraurelia]CAK81446.1 unnamed protein product [Paramecium tetraurelia]|eukprot:XP_001448843.1 hypothetical protein (macronuclear) [Paramecium tetraurelia strain d4-2]